MDPLLTLDNISLRYQNKKALYNINLNIMSNEFLTLIGPNGAGKTSLLKILIGLEKPTGGTIYRKPKLKISYLPQKFECNPLIPLSVGDFLRLSAPVSKPTIVNALENIDLSGYERRFLTDLSGGELQRVLIAKALLLKPDLLILDEPGQNIDYHGQILIYKLIEDLYKSLRCSVLMVSHDIHLVMSQTNTVICMYGHICCKGKPESIRNDDSFIRHFGKNSSQLLSTYRHVHTHSHGTASDNVSTGGTPQVP